MQQKLHSITKKWTNIHRSHFCLFDCLFELFAVICCDAQKVLRGQILQDTTGQVRHFYPAYFSPRTINFLIKMLKDLIIFQRYSWKLKACFVYLNITRNIIRKIMVSFLSHLYLASVVLQLLETSVRYLISDWFIQNCFGFSYITVQYVLFLCFTLIL